MPIYNPKIFTAVDQLSSIHSDLLIQLLRQFPAFFDAHGIQLDQDVLDFEAVCRALFAPKDDVQADEKTHELMDALQLITEMSHQDAMDSLLAAARENNISLNFGLDHSPADVAIDCWLHHANLFHTEHAKSLVKNYRGFRYFLGSVGHKCDLPHAKEVNIKAMQNELDDWFASNNRLRACRIYLFPQGSLLSIVIKYGKPLKREMKMKDGETESIFYHPQCHDLLIYDSEQDEIKVKTDTKKGQLLTYLHVIGQHLFGDEAYFKEKKTFSLKKLQDIKTSAHDFATIDGVEEVKLVELQYDWGGEIEIRRSGNLLETLIRNNGQHGRKNTHIVYAKFSIRFNGHKKPRKVGIRAGNLATFCRDEDSLIVEQWIDDQGFVEKH